MILMAFKIIPGKGERFRKVDLGGGKSYVFDRIFLKWVFLPLFLYLAVVSVWLAVHGNASIVCPEAGGVDCWNPYFERCDDVGLCGLEFLPVGYSYNVPPWWVADATFISLFVALGFFVVNHLNYNVKGG